MSTSCDVYKILKKMEPETRKKILEQIETEENKELEDLKNNPNMNLEKQMLAILEELKILNKTTQCIKQNNIMIDVEDDIMYEDNIIFKILSWIPIIIILLCFISGPCTDKIFC